MVDAELGEIMEIKKLEYEDVIPISKVLKASKAVTSNRVVKEVLEHLSEGIALKAVEDGDIVGVWCSREYENHTSLSYFYVDESIRRKPQLAVFFKYCIESIDRYKPLLITARSVEGFERYVEKIGENLYKYIGLR